MDNISRGFKFLEISVLSFLSKMTLLRLLFGWILISTDKNFMNIFVDLISLYLLKKCVKPWKFFLAT